MRKFWLENASGVRRSLNRGGPAILENPSGLGVQMPGDFVDLTRGFFADADTLHDPQQPIAGTLVFSGGSVYRKYRALLNWIMAAGDGLVFCYDTGDGIVYRCRVKLSYLTKTELEGRTWMRCPVCFLPRSRWYLLADGVITTSESDAGTYTYPLLYDGLRWPSEFRGAMTGAFTSSGHIGSALTLSYTGAVANPVITLKTAAGALLGRCAVSATLGATDTLLYSSRPDDCYVRKQDASGAVTDLGDDIDVSAEPYPLVLPNTRCILTITGDASVTGSCKWQIEHYYRGV